MSKLKSQKLTEKVDKVPEIEPSKTKKKVKDVKVPEIEPVVEDDEEEEDNEDENGEEPVEEKGLEVVEETPKNPEQISQARAEEIQLLQNDGVFRQELLYQLGALNENIKDQNILIAGVIENAK